MMVMGPAAVFIRYSLYEPLHQLWVGYMTELLQPSSHRYILLYFRGGVLPCITGYACTSQLSYAASTKGPQG